MLKVETNSCTGRAESTVDGKEKLQHVWGERPRDTHAPIRVAYSNIMLPSRPVNNMVKHFTDFQNMFTVKA